MRPGVLTLYRSTRFDAPAPLPEGVTVRAYRPEDWSTYIKLDLEAAIASGSAYHTSAEGLSRLKWIENRLKDFEMTPRGPKPLLWSIAVAVAGEQVVGEISWVGRESPRGPLLEITSIGVAPARRREGLATALLADAGTCARAAGVEVMTLDVAEVNSTAVALYERLGFSPDPG